MSFKPLSGNRIIEDNDGFYNGTGIQANFIIMPYRIIESELDDANQLDTAICNCCNKVLDRLRKNNYEWVSHNLAECMTNLVMEMRNEQTPR